MWARPSGRAGLRIRGQRGDTAVRSAVVRFAKWLRTRYDFPVRVPVYLSPRKRLVTMYGESVTASLFAPWKPDVEPYIRIATGDYPADRAQLGRDNALAGYLASLAHELIHYHQWVGTGSISERGVAVKARGIVEAYARTVSRP